MRDQITRHHPPVHTLEGRRTQLEARVERLRAAVRAASGHDPSHGRELDEASSRLAQVRAELARLHRDDAPAGRRGAANN